MRPCRAAHSARLSCASSLEIRQPAPRRRPFPPPLSPGVRNHERAARRVPRAAEMLRPRRQPAQGQPNVTATSASAGEGRHRSTLISGFGPTVARCGFARGQFCQTLASRLAEGRLAHVAFNLVEADIRRGDLTSENEIMHRHVPGIGERELRRRRGVARQPGGLNDHGRVKPPQPSHSSYDRDDRARDREILQAALP